MTDAQAHTGSNGHAAPPKTKRKIASSSVSGSAVTVKFHPDFGGHELALDTSVLTPEMRNTLAAQGAASAIQTAYSAPKADPVAAAEAVIKRILAGDWRPGPARGEAVSDALMQAVADHLSKETGKPHSPEYVESTFLPAYQTKHGLATIGAARRRLGQHPDISARRASIEAERAKRVADAVKKAPRENLLDV